MDNYSYSHSRFDRARQRKNKSRRRIWIAMGGGMLAIAVMALFFVYRTGGLRHMTGWLSSVTSVSSQSTVMLAQAAPTIHFEFYSALPSQTRERQAAQQAIAIVDHDELERELSEMVNKKRAAL